MDEEKDDIKKIQKSIDDILGIESGLAKKRPTLKAKKRELFNTIITGLAHINSRSLSLKHDYKIDMMEYDDPFYIALENLIKLHYTQEQQNVINWWLYDKFLPTGEVLILTNKETEEVIPSETPEDIWDLIQEHEKKNNK